MNVKANYFNKNIWKYFFKTKILKVIILLLRNLKSGDINLLSHYFCLLSWMQGNNVVATNAVGKWWQLNRYAKQPSFIFWQLKKKVLKILQPLQNMKENVICTVSLPLRICFALFPKSRFELWWNFGRPTWSLACEKNIFYMHAIKKL